MAKATRGAAPAKKAAAKKTVDPAGLLPATTENYILVETMGHDVYNELTDWARDNDIHVDSFMIRHRTAVPYDTYKDFMVANGLV